MVLIGGQCVDVDTHCGQLEGGNSLVDVLRHFVDLVLEVLTI